MSIDPGFRVLCGLAQSFPTNVQGVSLERGQALVSIRELADQTGWSKSKVHRWLGRWHSAGMATIQRRQGSRTLVTIEPGLYSRIATARPDDFEGIAVSIRSRIGLPASDPTVLEKSLIRRWVQAWKLTVPEILEIAERAAPEILMQVDRIDSLDVFSEFMEAAYAND